MNRAETANLLAMLAAAFPNTKPTNDAAALLVWEASLRDLPYPTVERAALDLIATSAEYMPTIAQVRRRAMVLLLEIHPPHIYLSAMKHRRWKPESRRCWSGPSGVECETPWPPAPAWPAWVGEAFEAAGGTKALREADEQFLNSRWLPAYEAALVAYLGSPQAAADVAFAIAHDRPPLTPAEVQALAAAAAPAVGPGDLADPVPSPITPAERRMALRRSWSPE